MAWYGPRLGSCSCCTPTCNCRVETFAGSGIYNAYFKQLINPNFPGLYNNSAANVGLPLASLNPYSSGNLKPDWGCKCIDSDYSDAYTTMPAMTVTVSGSGTAQPVGSSGGPVGTCPSWAGTFVSSCTSTFEYDIWKRTGPKIATIFSSSFGGSSWDAFYQYLVAVLHRSPNGRTGTGGNPQSPLTVSVILATGLITLAVGSSSPYSNWTYIGRKPLSGPLLNDEFTNINVNTTQIFASAVIYNYSSTASHLAYLIQEDRCPPPTCQDAVQVTKCTQSPVSTGSPTGVFGSATSQSLNECSMSGMTVSVSQ